MKNLNFSLLALIALLGTTLLFTACKKDDDNDNIVGSWVISSTSYSDPDCGLELNFQNTPCTATDSIGCAYVVQVFNADMTYSLMSTAVLDSGNGSFFDEDMESGTYTEENGSVILCPSPDDCEDPQSFVLSNGGNTSTVIDAEDPDCIQTTVFTRR